MPFHSSLLMKNTLWIDLVRSSFTFSLLFPSFAIALWCFYQALIHTKHVFLSTNGKYLSNANVNTNIFLYLEFHADYFHWFILTRVINHYNFYSLTNLYITMEHTLSISFYLSHFIYIAQWLRFNLFNWNFVSFLFVCLLSSILFI